jgi:hypothetical protein
MQRQTNRRLALFLRRYFLGVGAFAAVLILSTETIAGTITPGNLVVVRAAGGPNGDATAALQGSGTAAQVFLDEYTTAGVLVQTITMPGTRSTTVGSQRALTLSGTANTEGHLTLSGNGQYLIMAGYNQTATQAGTNNVASGGDGVSTAVERVIGRVSLLGGTIDTSTALIDAMSSQNVRSAYSFDGTGFWLTGNGGNNATINTVSTPTSGVHFATLGVQTGATLSTQVNTAQLTSNNRVVQGYNGKLFVSNGSPSTSSTPLRGLVNDFTGGGAPVAQGTASGPFLQALPGFATAAGPSPSDFSFFNDTTIYLADTRTDGTNGGIQKWTFDGTNWLLQYTLATGLRNVADTAFVGVHGLAVTPNGLGQAVLFGTTFDGTGANQNKFFFVTDTGVGAPVTILGTSGTNTAFRGIEFIMVPEPGSIILLRLAGFGALAVIRRRR